MSDWIDEARSYGWHPIEDCPGALKVGAANTRAERVEGLLDEARVAIAEAIRGGEHDGPCLNYEGQELEHHSPWDSCYLHLAAAAARRESLRAFLASLDGTEPKEEQSK